MKVNKFMVVGILLLAILFIGAVSAAEEYNVTATDVVVDTGDYVLNSPVIDEIGADSYVNSSDSSAAISTDVKSVENSNEKLGVSNDEDVLGVDYDYILTPQGYKDQGFGHELATGSYKFEGIFRADDGFWSFISFDDGCIVDGSEAEFVDMGIILSGNCQITGLTLTSTKYLEDDVSQKSPGAIVYVTGDDNILDGITVNYAPAADGDAYGIYAINANDFQLLNSNITFTGSSLQDYYEYAMRMETCDNVLVQANTITANLPILDVDYNKGDPGLATDLVLNTGIREVTNLNIINNTFIANVVDRNGNYPTLDCVMMEYCGYVNVTNNKFRETDFITNEGDANYLNVLDMYYSSNVLVNGNDISVETTGGSENAGTSYPIQLTGPYENVLIDGNDLYANCGGPALGIFSQNYYGDTEITVQNNNIDVTGLPTDHNWGLVSGIELQDNVARVYNNTITTKSITGSYEDGMNIYGISYAQALNENHNYDIRGNTIETEGKYAIYLLKAQDTTITDNYLVSSIAEGDDAVYIQDASGDTVIENNHGAKENNVVTQDNFYDFFNSEGFLLDSVEFDELIFQGQFENLVDFITIEKPLTITGDKATLNNIGFLIQGDDCTLNNLKFVADTNLGSLILVDGVYGATLSNLNIFYDGGDESAIAINVEGDGAQILNNTIFFESHVPDDTEFAVGLKLTGCTDILVDGNDITTKLPCVYCNNYDEDYYMMGSDKVDPVRLKDCTNLVFTNNYINSTTNDFSAEFPTIQSIQIIGCKNSSLDHNIISMIDEMTPAGMDNYLYGINFGYNRNVTFSNNNFNMSTLGGKDAAGTAYAFQGVESEVNIIGNSITSISNGPNLGIYVASMFGGDSDLIIEDNFINVTGSASSTGSWALVSGIEIQNGDAKIYNNTVYTYNVNDYDDYAYMYGISYAQWMYGERSFDIQNNTVYTEGKYAISVINATSLNAERNTLYAHELTGDDSINPGSCADVNIKNNLPKKITNIVTQDNFYDFFDESGNLLDNVTFDVLIFQGTFSDLVSYITIDRALTITGDNAVLNDIAFVIAGSGVTLDNMTLVANSNLGNLIDIAAENVVISNMNITYVVDEAASAINVYPGANNVQILNNTIYFESTVDAYAMDEVTTAICVNSGVSVFGDEDPIEGLVIDGNTITAVIPAFLADVYENEYYVMGLSAVNGVRINGAEDFKFTNNNLNVTTNWLYRTTPTFQALYVASSSGLIDRNNISMIDTFAPEGNDVYLYAVELIKDKELTISNNNFNLSTTGGKDEAGSAYAIIAIESNFNVVDNNITTVSNGPNLAIYFPSNMGAPCEAVISGNFINVTGLATAAHNTGLVSGIEIQTGDVEITGNTIYTYNIGEYAEGNYIYGIGYAQEGVTPNVVITDNTVYTEGHYAISFLKVDDAVITDNYLVSTDLKGDNAVEIKAGSGNTVENNTPGSSPANISIEANPIWIGSNATVGINVPNATGTVTIEINGKSYTIELDNGAATIEIPAGDLIAGENNVTVTYDGPEFDTTTATGVLYVADGVVTQDTYLFYFNQADNGKFFDYIPEGVTLDFQGSIINPDQEIIVQMNVNKPVNIISSTGDAYVDLNTTAGSLLGESPGNSFAITYGGSGTNVSGINFHNTQLWFSNTHNVILDNISNVVEDQRVGSGVGATSIRDNSTNVTLKNSYFYTRNNGGSTTFTFSWASNCTIDNCTLRAEGNVGNLLYLNTFNVVGAPTGVPLNNYNVVSNNRIYGKEGSAISVGLMVEGKGNLIVNNTLYKSSISTSFGGANPSDNIYVGNTMTEGSGLTAQANSIVYGNNVTGALSTGTNSVAYDNIVDGKMTVAAGATAYNNTVGNGLTTGGANAVIENNTIAGVVTINKVGINFVGNDVAGTVTVSANNNVIKGNNITTTGNYAVDLGTKTGNNVTDNYLVAASYKGDKAVKFTNANNVVENNTPVAPVDVVAETVWIGNNATVTVTVANTNGSVTISVNGKEQTVELVGGVATVTVSGEDLVAGENMVTVTYNGPEYAPATVDDAIIVLNGVVTQDTYLYYFNQDDNGKFFDYIPEGATLDFQGSIINPDQEIIVQMNVNKPVNIISSTGDAYVDLNTTAGSLLGESPGNSFAITYGGSGTNVTGINFHNTQLWFSNTHNVILDNISNVVEDQRVGSGVGATSIRDNSTNVTLKNSYFYTRNNGGSTTFTFSWASNCTIDNCTFRAEGNVGNLLYLNIFNVVGAPTGVPLNNYNVVSNNRIYGKEGSAISVGLMVEGKGNLIVNNTLYKSSISTSFGGANPSDNIYVGNTMTEGSGLTAQANSIVYGNNVTGALSIGANSVVYDNIVGGKMTVAAGATAYNNTVGNGLATGGANAVIENNTITGAVTINKVGTTFVGNDVAGTVTVSANNNVIKGNNITTTGNYAVDLGAKTGNNVTDNYLVAALYKGDAAVKFTNANNVVENNTPVTSVDVVAETVWIGNNATVTVTVANTTGTVTVVVNGKEQTVELVDGVATVTVAGEDLVAGENMVTVTYNGPEYAPATVDDTIIVLDGVITNSTYKYYFDASGNLVSVVPNGVTLDFQGLFLGKFPVYINKAVNVVSTTGDALFDCGASYAGNNINSFNIVAGGDNTNITGLEFINYCLYIKGASNVTVDDISIVANKRGVGSGTGFLSIHTGAYNTLVKNSYFENGGTGSSLLVLGKGGAYAVFDHNVFNITGSSGNILSANQFVGSGSSPEHVSYTNNVLYNNQPGSAFCYAMTVSGSGNLVENNTIYHNGSGILNQYGASSSGNVYRNNTLYGNTNFNPSANSIVENNKIYATTNIAANTTVSGNTFTTVAISGTDTKFVNNTVTGTVTVSGNANSIVGNNITTTGDYAVVLGTTAGNNVTDNYLISALYGGDAAVKYSNENNIVENNSPKGNLTADRFEDGLTINVGDKITLNATLTDDAGKVISNATVVFLLNDTEYTAVTDAEGKVYFDLSGIALGEYLVNYRFDGNGNYSKCDLTVNDKLTVSKIPTVINVTSESISLEIDEEVNVNATLTPADAGNLTYTSSNESVVKVDSNGKIIAVGEGTANITVSFAGDENHTAADVTVTVTVSKVATEISVENATVGMEVNDEVAAGAALTHADAGNVTYTVSNSSVVKVEDGKIIALAEGSAVITVSFAGDDKYAAAENKTISVTVKLKDASVSVENATLDLLIGDNDTIVAVTSPEGLDVTYLPDNSGVVSVDENGVVTALKEGTASIIVKVGGDGIYAENSTIVTVVVSKVPTEISIENATVDMEVNDEVAAGAALTPADAGNVTYTVSNSSVVKVEDGKIIALAEGSAVITVSFAGDDKYAAAENKTIGVIVKLKDAGVSVDNATLDLLVGENATIVAVTSPEGLDVTYLPDNSGIYSVDENGVVTALKEGTASIIVKVGGDGLYAENSTIVTVVVSKVPTEISVDPVSLDLVVGNESSIVATLTPVEAGNVTFTSSDESVVTVDANGNVVAVGEGNANITVSFAGDDKYAAADVTVTVTVSKVSTEISIENATVDMEVNDEVAAGAALTPADAGNVTYTVSNSSVVKVEDGKIIALAEGSAVITVSFAGDDKYAAAENKTISVTVKLKDAGVSVDNATLDLLVGENATIVAVTSPEGLDVTYLPDNSGVVSVDENGVVTALKEGTASIIVKVGGDGIYAENSTIVTVVVSKVPTEISVDPASLDLVVGNESAIVATLTPVEAGNVAFTSSDESVVTVDANGNVVAVGEGTATITVSFAGDDKYAAAENETVSVSVAPKPKENATISIDAPGEATEGDNVTVTVTLPEDATGTVTIGNEVVTVQNGTASAVLTNVPAGNTTVPITYSGDDKYNPIETGVNISVAPKGKENATISIDAPSEATEGDNVTVTVTLPEDATGTVTIGNEAVPVVNGTASAVLTNVPAGNTTVPITYSGDDKYNPIETGVNIAVKEDTSNIISAPDVTKYYKGPERFVVTVTDYKGNPLANKTVIISINGKDYTRTTDANGTAGMAIGLPSKVYNVTVTVDNQTVKSVVTVLSTVNGTDVVKMYRNGTQYYATFLDSEGKYLADGTAVQFNINGILYERKISGDKGLARLNINLPAGEYTITAMNPQTGENAANNITVLATIVENRDITKYYKNATQYTVKVLGADGKPVGAGETVSFNINGVVYKRTTDASGIAKININLAPGDYVITAEYKGFTVANNITVLPVLSAKDITMKYRDGTKFVATLVDGQGKPYAKQAVQFNINGVMYNRQTDASGQAKLNINLMAGEYIITSSYNGANIANKITITA